MDEESFNTSIFPVIIKPDGVKVTRGSVGKQSLPSGGGNPRRNSIGEPTFSNKGQNILPPHIRGSTGSFHDVVNPRRNSIGKPSSPNCGKSVVPNYLRASTGSCHDFCKYGRKHEVEVKPWRPLPKKKLIKHSNDNRIPTESGALAERKVMKVIKPKPDSPSTLKQENSSSDKVKASSNAKKVAHNEKKNQFSVEHIPSVKPKAVTVKPSSSSGTSRVLTGKDSEAKMLRTIGTSKAAVRKELPSSAIVNRAVSLNVKKYKNLKLLSPLKDLNRIRKSEAQPPNSEKVPEKTLHVVNVVTEKRVPESTPVGPALQSLPSPPPKLSSFPKSPDASSHAEEEEEEYEYSDSEADELDDSVSRSSEILNLQDVDSDRKTKRAPRKAGDGLSKGKDSIPTKLKFRRGKVVDLQSQNSSPRRLKFRRGKLLRENQDSNADIKRSFRKREVDDDTNDAGADSGKVVLRHQDVQGKKDAQGLLNNVIEETASKLVESRKSKVKALVGAFETVISLQESKPSTQTVT